MARATAQLYANFSLLQGWDVGIFCPQLYLCCSTSSSLWFSDFWRAWNWEVVLYLCDTIQFPNSKYGKNRIEFLFHGRDLHLHVMYRYSRIRSFKFHNKVRRGRSKWEREHCSLWAFWRPEGESENYIIPLCKMYPLVEFLNFIER